MSIDSQNLWARIEPTVISLCSHIEITWFRDVWKELRDFRPIQITPDGDIRNEDLTIVQLDLWAVCWLFHDATLEPDSHEYPPEIYWEEWIDLLGINPWSLLVHLNDKAFRAVRRTVVEHHDPLALEPNIDGGLRGSGEALDEHSLTPTLLCLAAATLHRDGVLRALWRRETRLGVDYRMELMAAVDGKTIDEAVESAMADFDPVTIPTSHVDLMRRMQWFDECCQVLHHGVPSLDWSDADEEIGD